MARLHWADIHEGDNDVVLIEEARRRVAADDGAEDAVGRLGIRCRHRPRIVPASPPLSRWRRARTATRRPGRPSGPTSEAGTGLPRAPRHPAMRAIRARNLRVR